MPFASTAMPRGEFVFMSDAMLGVALPSKYAATLPPFDTNTAVCWIVSEIVCVNGVAGLFTGVAVAVSEIVPGVTTAGAPLVAACTVNAPGVLLVICTFGDADVRLSVGAPAPRDAAPFPRTCNGRIHVGVTTTSGDGLVVGYGRGSVDEGTSGGLTRHAERWPQVAPGNADTAERQKLPRDQTIRQRHYRRHEPRQCGTIDRFRE